MYKKRFAMLLSLPLISGTIWITAGNLLVSLGNYGFNLMMGRFLTASEFGIYTSLISLSIIISLPAGVITTIATKFSADYSSVKLKNKLARLSQRLTIIAGISSFVLLVILLFLSSQIARFLNIEGTGSIAIIAIIVGLGLVASVNRGLLQGLLRFKFLSFLGVVAVVVKIVTGFIFVPNLKVLGGLLALLLASILAWGLSFIPIKSLFLKKVKSSIGIRRRILRYGVPTISYNVALMLFLSLDILLVKHFFDSNTAGVFSASTIMGKAIFYLTAPIASVFFPVLAQKYSQHKPFSKDILLTLTMVAIPGIVAVLGFLLFPEFIVKIFFPGKGYELSAQYIGWYGVYMLFSSLNLVFANLFLAIEQTQKTSLLLISMIIQGFGIYLFHDTIYQVLLILITVSMALLLVHSIYLIKMPSYVKKE